MATTKLITAEDLLLMSEDEGRFELIEGELREMSPTGEEHGEISALLTSFLVIHVRQHQLGTVYAAETGFHLSRNPDVVLAPDVAFIRAGRLSPDRDRSKYIEIAPDLAVEVISPSDRMADVNDKVMIYLEAGVQTIWVVDPRRQIVTAYGADRNARLLTTRDSLDAGDIVPGFSIPVADIFR